MRSGDVCRMCNPDSASTFPTEVFAALLLDWPRLNRSRPRYAESRPGVRSSGHDRAENETSIGSLAQYRRLRFLKNAAGEKLHVRGRNLRKAGEFVSACVGGVALEKKLHVRIAQAPCGYFGEVRLELAVRLGKLDQAGFRAVVIGKLRSCQRVERPLFKRWRGHLAVGIEGFEE